MRRVVGPDRSLHRFRLVILAVVSLVAASCSPETSRFDSNPYRSQSSANQQASSSVAKRQPSVQSTPLPPPNSVSMQTPSTRSNSAPPAPRVASSAPAKGGNVVHTIAPGETLMKLSRQYGKPLSAIAKANKVEPNAKVKVGDKITIPGAAATQIAAPKQPTPAVQQPKQAASPKMAAIPASSTSSSANVVTPAAQQPVPEKVKADVSAAVPAFRWPVRGRVITGFGPKPSGQQNDGINVAVPEGSPVKAADDGVVAYAGNELKTYGNLVLVRHSNGYVTAYAHASEILVKRDEPVKRGQVIAKAGQTGSVAAPQLHFEIRKGSTPVDPMPFLDKGGST